MKKSTFFALFGVILLAGCGGAPTVRTTTTTTTEATPATADAPAKTTTTVTTVKEQPAVPAYVPPVYYEYGTIWYYSGPRYFVPPPVRYVPSRKWYRW